MIIVTLLYLMIVVCHCVCGKVITVNNNGNSSDLCCRYGMCECSSLYNAASLMGNNTVINITSQNVSLGDNLEINCLNNIKINGNGATIMCNNTGTVTCNECSNVIFEGITWDQCGPRYIGIEFEQVSNISIINCTFQRFRVCMAVLINNLVGIMNVISSKFMNNLKNVTWCNGKDYSSLYIFPSESASVNVYDSLFYNNGNPYKDYQLDDSSLLLYIGTTVSILVHNTSFVSNSIGSMYIYSNAAQSAITFNGINVSNNQLGVYVFFGGGVGGNHLLTIISSHFLCNRDRTPALNATYATYGGEVNIELYNTTFANNLGTRGTALNIITGNDSVINMTLCTFFNNTGGDSIIYINSYVEFPFPFVINNVIIHSSNFTNNKIGSILKLTKCYLKFYSTTLFQDNSARSGAALYIVESSQISVDDGSTVQFINNTASLRGGAMYIDLTNCYDHGIVFTNFTGNGSIFFTDNSAELSGNSIYFDIPSSCDVIRDYTNNNSAAYVPYKFNYTQSHDINDLPIIASPYEIKICSSSKCNFTNSTNYFNNIYKVEDDVMLGESVYFSTALYDYFNATAEPTNFQVTCINCGSKFRLLNNQLLVQNGSRNRINMLSIDTNADVENDTSIILNISSLLSPEYRQLTATLSLTLSSCNNGFLFSEQSQQCECYNKGDYLQCDEDSANIKLGYWFGVFHEKLTLSACYNDYCNFFTHRKETRGGFYNLPEEIDDQCNSHRTGAACGQCSEGYTLAYNSPDCISVDKCSPGMTVLVIILIILYWIVIIAMLFGVAYYLNTQQISPGYLYSITFFYSIVDILLVTNLHLTDGVFYTATILSSFAKLNPQFLGRLCFVENLDAIDQQFIHYCHVVFISIILIVIYIIARCNNRALMYVNRGIVPVTCFVLIFSYTSMTSTSLLLLRAVKFDDIDGLYTYLSPHLKYFANRHAAYASVALLCVLLVTIGFPLLLVMEPLVMKVFNGHFNNIAWKNVKLHIKRFLEKWTCFVRIKQLLDQLQDCYKDQYRWFAAYYLICRLVIMLITYFANDDYNYMIYYLQTACVVITMTHIWIQPYKNDLINKLDTAILLIMLLVVNVSAFSFSTSAIEGVAITLIHAPLILLFGFSVRKYLVAMMRKKLLTGDGDSNLCSSSTPG